MTASNKAKTTTEDDWFGELLVGLVALTGKGLFRFALRWPDTATLLTIFAITGMLAGLRVACLLTAVCAAGCLWLLPRRAGGAKLAASQAISLSVT